MSEQFSARHAYGSPTGTMRPVEIPDAPHEPPLPRTLPELDEPDATTGSFPIVAEHEDATRNRDDSLTISSPIPAVKQA